MTDRGEPDGAATIEEQYRAACAAIDASYEAHLKMLREFRENPFADDPLWWYKPLRLNESSPRPGRTSCYAKRRSTTGVGS